MSWARGYTLIEVLVVMLILSIATSVAVLSINHNETTQFKSVSFGLVNALKLAQTQAMLEPNTIKLEIKKHGVKFYRYQYDPSAKHYYWQAMNEKVFKKLTFGSDIFFQLNDGDNIFFFASGDMTPFTLQLQNKKHETLYQIRGNAAGELRNEKIA